jgi:hypothetical protein
VRIATRLPDSRSTKTSAWRPVSGSTIEAAAPRLLLERLHAERDRLGFDVSGEPAGVKRPAIVGEPDHWLVR